MELRHTIRMAVLLTASAAVVFAQQKQPPQHGDCEVQPPPGCPPETCASPGAAPEWPCRALDERRRELEARLERLRGNIRAVERALQNQHGRAVTDAELDVFDGVTFAASFASAVLTGGGSLAAKIAIFAAKEIGQQAAIAAATAGVQDIVDPMQSSALEAMSIEALENLANVLAKARFMAGQELGALRGELAECNAEFNKSHDEWSAKQEAYEACQFKYGEALAECKRYFRRHHKDCPK